MPRKWDEVVQARGWEACLEVARNFSDHYSMHEEQQAYLYEYAMRLPHDAIAFEVGVCNGKTSAVLAYCAKLRGFQAHGVDCFLLENTPEAFRAKMAEHALSFTLHVARSNQCPVGTLTLPAIEWTEPIDLLLVDASHTDPWVSADLAYWTPLVKPGGVAFFHDYDGREDRLSPHVDTRRAIDHYTADWFMEYFVGGLMIKRKPLHPEPFGQARAYAYQPNTL